MRGQAASPSSSRTCRSGTLRQQHTSYSVRAMRRRRRRPFHVRPLLLDLIVLHHPGQRGHNGARPAQAVGVVQTTLLNHSTPPEGQDRLSPPPCGRYRPARNPGPLTRHAIIRDPGPACKLRGCLIISVTHEPAHCLPPLDLQRGPLPSGGGPASGARGRGAPAGAPVTGPHCRMLPSARSVSDGVSVITRLYTARPRRENWRKPSTSLMMPITGSTVDLRPL